MKKTILAVLTAFCLLFTACVGEKSAEEPKGTTKTGVITRLNISEVEYNKIINALGQNYRPSKANPNVEFKFFDRMSDLLAALNDGQIDIFSTYQHVADYIEKRNKNLERLDSERHLEDSFCFAVREGDTALKNDLNKAIKDMIADGTLANLTKQYIAELQINTEPPAVPITKIDGAETLKVAVTGDLPPFDLILPDGTPAGFSTAVLAEISRRIGKNIELINVDSNARAEILASNGADIVFWVSVPKDSTLVPENIDKPAGIDVSDPYFHDLIVHVGTK